MKYRLRIPIALAALALAFTAGWFARGNGTSSSPTPASGGRAASGPGEMMNAAEKIRHERPAREHAEPVVESEEGGLDPATDRAGLAAFLARGDRAFEVRLAEWTRALGLTPDQQARLRQAEAGRRSKIEAAWTDGGLDSSADLPALGDDAMDETMKGLLDASQAGDLARWQAAKAEQQTRSRATARLAELEGLTLLTAEQREAVYAKFQDTAFSEGDGLPAGGTGVAPDAAFLSEVTRRMSAAGETDFHKAAGAMVKEGIAKQVDGLKEILQPEQLEAYRLSLETRHAGWLIGQQ